MQKRILAPLAAMTRNHAPLLVRSVHVLRGVTLLAIAPTLPAQEVHHDRVGVLRLP